MRLCVNRGVGSSSIVVETRKGEDPEQAVALAQALFDRMPESTMTSDEQGMRIIGGLPAEVFSDLLDRLPDPPEEKS